MYTYTNYITICTVSTHTRHHQHRICTRVSTQYMRPMLLKHRPPFDLVPKLWPEHTLSCTEAKYASCFSWARSITHSEACSQPNLANVLVKKRDIVFNGTRQLESRQTQKLKKNLFLACVLRRSHTLGIASENNSYFGSFNYSIILQKLLNLPPMVGTYGTLVESISINAD